MLVEILESATDHWKRTSEGISRNRMKKASFIIPFPWQPINIGRLRYANLVFSGFSDQFIGKRLRSLKVDRLNCSF